MSNSRAIAAVTASLRSLLDRRINADSTVDPDSDPLLTGTEVTTRPPDRARNNISGKQLNLFLYQTVPNAAWRNMDMPRQVKPGETGAPPLALNLYYLVSAYCDDDDTDGVTSHRLLGRAMSVLHDHPLLGRQEVEAALPESGLPDQIERLRITPQSLSLQQMFNLWSTFQTQYRVSAAYEVTVVLIESTRAARAPLPVLTRGPGDQGVTAQPDLIPPFPTLEAMDPPNQQPSARLGDPVTLVGHHLSGTHVDVRFTNLRSRLPAPVTLTAAGTATEITVQIPNEPANWPAGPYMLQAMITQPDKKVRTTGELPLSLAPRLTLPASPIGRDATGSLTFTVSCVPQVRGDQSVVLLFGDREVKPRSVTTPANPTPPPTDPTAATALEFQVEDVLPGEYWLRLRVDGVDSLLVDRTVTPPVFDPSQKVTIT